MRGFRCAFIVSDGPSNARCICSSGYVAGFNKTVLDTFIEYPSTIEEVSIDEFTVHAQSKVNEVLKDEVMALGERAMAALNGQGTYVKSTAIRVHCSASGTSVRGARHRRHPLGRTPSPLLGSPAVRSGAL